MVIHNSHHPTTKRTGLGSSDKEFLVYLNIKIEHYINIANWSKLAIGVYVSVNDNLPLMDWETLQGVLCLLV